MAELSEIIEAVPISIVASIIRKDELARRYVRPENPYQLALLFCMERAREFLDGFSFDPDGIAHIVCEARGGSGGTEDVELEQEFRRICAGQNRLRPSPLRGFDIVSADKKTNSTGLQIADLVARPIGMHTLRPEQYNRAYEIIRPMIWDRKIFP
jgi:hypothetical protein